MAGMKQTFNRFSGMRLKHVAQIRKNICGPKVVRKVCCEGRYLALYLLLKNLDPSQRATRRYFHIGTIDINCVNFIF